MLLTRDLYNEVFNTETKHYKKVRVISGYASGTFLKRVVNDYPNLEIELYIGMARNGITLADHQTFVEHSNNKGVKVYYQIKGIQNHMKLYEFYNDISSTTYVGSANFSEQGFFNQLELLTKVSSNNNELFVREFSNSILCTDSKVADIIPINDQPELIIGAEEPMDYNDVANLNSDVSENDEQGYIRQLKFQNFRKNANIEYYQKFSLRVLSNSIKKWSYEGINGIFNQKDSKLLAITGEFFDNYFPKEIEFDIYADNGIMYKAKIDGGFYNELILIDHQFYDYINWHLKLPNLRPISKNDLEEFGATTIEFERIDETLFLMYMGNKTK
ncbi:phospholipase D family protein [Aerococcus urinaeequi]|uniref:phospholipase D family protein n=1 Tax=Aerococcus urinaeequi TaxID=51665 RepID=UPI0022DEA502|nr:phospholipase D family protein [Aerococcus urinaeequi]